MKSQIEIKQIAEDKIGKTTIGQIDVTDELREQFINGFNACQELNIELIENLGIV